MRFALLAQDLPVLCFPYELGTEDVTSNGNYIAYALRTTNDIGPTWSPTLSIINLNNFMAE